MIETDKEYFNIAIFIDNDILNKNLKEEIKKQIHQLSVQFHKEIEEQKEFA